ncbi:AAA family ATPase [Salinibacterium soli]|uniref:AAA family ATPase n=1 Tax=Antiquaquibacter soli TaxID=3064523 RepID=A0ABT9BNF9_9MICO|nr:AAA family ATPase [Protaetiibacter sp. WY-16]MDO7882574.1 AAA family ATPase [Protaetiibacter sp. WY-16]
MKLISFTLEGYRRFVAPTSVKLHADMVALIGPNEAGKSSVLRALTHLNEDGRFQANEHPRRSDAKPLLKWQFQLDDLDRAELNSVSEAREVQRVSITKGDDGVRRWSFFPAVWRDRSAREAAFKQIMHANGSLEHLAGEAGYVFAIDRSLEILDLDELDAAELAELEAVLSDIRNARDTLGPENLTKDQSEQVESVVIALQSAIEGEKSPHPTERARRALELRVPQIRLFEPADRNLQREYDLGEVADSPPPALRHLADVAELDLPALRDELINNEIADASTRRNRANARLADVFRSWNQEEIALQFEFQNSLLLIQATTPSDSGLSSIEERSDGMRWFAALLAFIQGSEDGPILLADEIETHLHYDAQADLIEVLARQRLISKVVYTTHSFGCLPFDIGNGVRVVQQTGLGTSQLVNGFWTTGSGFSPLLASMGAAAVTFTPTRRAVIGEGPTEAILLPTLLRQASGQPKLAFQVAPGLSSVASSAVANLETEAGQVAYLVDGDPGGLSIHKKLAATVPSQRIVVLKDPVTGSSMETEDLIDPSAYMEAVNDELQLWNASLPTFAPKALPTTMRSKAVESWCKRHAVAAPDKAALAQRIANMSGGRDVFDADRKDYIVGVLDQLTSALDYKSS